MEDNAVALQDHQVPATVEQALMVLLVPTDQPQHTINNNGMVKEPQTPTCQPLGKLITRNTINPECSPQPELLLEALLPQPCLLLLLMEAQEPALQQAVLPEQTVPQQARVRAHPQFSRP